MDGARESEVVAEDVLSSTGSCAVSGVGVCELCAIVISVFAIESSGCCWSWCSELRSSPPGVECVAVHAWDVLCMELELELELR